MRFICSIQRLLIFVSHYYSKSDAFFLNTQSNNCIKLCMNFDREQSKFDNKMSDFYKICYANIIGTLANFKQ